MARAASTASSKKGTSQAFRRLSNWVTKRATSGSRSTDRESGCSGAPIDALQHAGRPSLTIVRGGVESTSGRSDEETWHRSSRKSSSSTTLGRPSFDDRTDSTNPAPSLAPLSDVDGETTLFDARSHPPTPNQADQNPINMQMTQTRRPLRTKLSANNFNNFHDIERRLKQIGPVGAENPPVLGNGMEMYDKAMRLQEAVMKANKLPRT